jgi:hypothetical protein
MQQYGVKCINHIALQEIHVSSKHRIQCECDLSEDITPRLWEGEKLVRPTDRTLNIHKIWKSLHSNVSLASSVNKTPLQPSFLAAR